MKSSDQRYMVRLSLYRELNIVIDRCGEYRLSSREQGEKSNRMKITKLPDYQLQNHTISVPHKSCKCTTPCNFIFPSTTTNDVIFFFSIAARAVIANSPGA